MNHDRVSTSIVLNDRIPGIAQAQFATLARHLKNTVPLLFAVFVMLAFAMGCGSDSTEAVATPASTADTSSEPTATPSGNGQGAGASAPGQTRQGGQGNEQGLTQEPGPTATVSTPGETLPAEPPVTPTAPPATETPGPASGPTSTPGADLVSRSGEERNTSPDVSRADLQALVAGNNAFAFDLYGVLSESGGNLFFSPHSISTALAMAYAGARDETEHQMADTLGFELAQDRLHPAFNALDLSLSDRSDDNGDFRINIANSGLGTGGLRVSSRFPGHSGSELRRRSPSGGFSTGPGGRSSAHQ